MGRKQAAYGFAFQQTTAWCGFLMTRMVLIKVTEIMPGRACVALRSTGCWEGARNGRSWGDPLKSTHSVDRWKAGPEAGCWRVPGAGEEPGRWLEAWILHHSRACPVCPSRKQAYIRFIHPSNAQRVLCQPLHLPAPADLNCLPCRL